MARTAPAVPARFRHPWRSQARYDGGRYSNIDTGGRYELKVEKALAVSKTPNRDNKRNYYRILYVQPDAPMEVVQAAYRTIMQKLKAHPDLGGDHWNASVINEAFETLIDADRRRAYDAELFKQNDWKSLGQQSADQRDNGYAFDSTWEDFKPQVIK